MPLLRAMTTTLVLSAAAAVAAGPATAQALAPPATGYWLAGADGGVFAFNAPFYGSGVPTGACAFNPQTPSTLNSRLGCDALAPTSTGNGYWLVNAYRWPTAFGGAGSTSQTGCTSLNGATGAWTGMASSATGQGFFMVAANGGVIGCGDAVPDGGVTALTLTAPVVGIVPTPDHQGYWLVAADGGVFAFGDAGYFGSLAGRLLNAPVVGMAATADGQGYWLAAADGGVFAFGDAGYLGSLAGRPLNAPVVGMAATPSGPGYWLAGADGGVFAFGNAPFEGSMVGQPEQGPIVGIAAHSVVCGDLAVASGRGPAGQPRGSC